MFQNRICWNHRFRSETATGIFILLHPDEPRLYFIEAWYTDAILLNWFWHKFRCRLTLFQKLFEFGFWLLFAFLLILNLGFGIIDVILGYIFYVLEWYLLFPAFSVCHSSLEWWILIWSSFSRFLEWRALWCWRTRAFLYQNFMQQVPHDFIDFQNGESFRTLSIPIVVNICIYRTLINIRRLLLLPAYVPPFPFFTLLLWFFLILAMLFPYTLFPIQINFSFKISVLVFFVLILSRSHDLIISVNCSFYRWFCLGRLIETLLEVSLCLDCQDSLLFDFYLCSFTFSFF